MNKVIVLQIRESGEADTVYLCKTYAVTHRIIREWFDDSIENINSYDIDKLQDELWERDIGYWDITEQKIWEEVICK